MKRWYVKNKKANYQQIQRGFEISELMTRLLVNRDITDEELIKSFIDPSIENLHNPRTMKDVEKAIGIILNKIEEKSKIRIIGDYDVDGVISSYILYVALQRCGAEVDYEIPDRVKDGYGINQKIMEKAKEEGVDTIITCDNGISAIDPISYGKELGLTIIVTDHHEVPFVEDEAGNRTFISSSADAIINPRQTECNYKAKNLCGAGVAFKLIQVLYEEKGIPKEESYPLIEYVAIATVCDVVDLIDENRIFVKQGLEMINKTANIGLRALMKENQIEDKTISTYHLGFILGPCINASGRLDSAKKGLRLLIAEDQEEANALAKELHELNQERKSMTLHSVEQAIDIIETTDLKEDKVFVIYLPNTHESLAGIVAGRIKENYHVPTIVITKTVEGAKGSGRSIEGYHMFEELLKCKELLGRFGGHPMAAGLSLEEENIQPLRQKLNAMTTLTEEDLLPKIYLDMQIPLDLIDYDFIEELNKLAPFGKGNSKPLFGEKHIQVVRGHILGKNKNVLKLRLISKKGNAFEAIYFGEIQEFERKVIDQYGEDQLRKLYQGTTDQIYMDLAFHPGINEYNGNVNVQLVIEDFR